MQQTFSTLNPRECIVSHSSEIAAGPQGQPQGPRAAGVEEEAHCEHCGGPGRRGHQAQAHHRGAGGEAGAPPVAPPGPLGISIGHWTAFGLGALGATALMILGANRQNLKPAIVSALSEVDRFKDWARTSVAKVKEDLSDMAAEASHRYDEEIGKHLETIEREKELVSRLANLAKKRSEET